MLRSAVRSFRDLSIRLRTPSSPLEIVQDHEVPEILEPEQKGRDE
jgi:hypothetical protein